VSQTKPCAVCALRIPATAKVCTHCNNVQAQWMRWAKQCSFGAAAIVAFLPLGDAALSLREIAAGRHRADVKVEAVSCSSSAITIAVMNFGKGPAFIGSPSFRVAGSYSGDASQILLRSESTVAVIEPSAVKTLQLVGWIGSASVALPSRKGAEACSYQTTLQINDAYGATTREAACECPAS
jgi:hypothetical protein